ncbi:hypothetical protein [Amycolatopsis sp. NPDC051903]|uniref:hypothetical protein n=1 Tax=Amycolatopsis sp. NPDC051903 TaxID=3363936 RepID=UPI00378777F5
MEDPDVRALFSHPPAGPPLSLSASDVITRGSRIRRRRKRLAVAGSSMATALVLVLAGLAVGHRGTAGPAPVEPAGPGLSTVAPVPSPSAAPGSSLPAAPPLPETTQSGTETPPRRPGQAPGEPPRTLPSSPRTPSHAPPLATLPTQNTPAPPTATTR